MARYDYDITIIGGGSGGLTAARLARALGARVLLIDKERLGGDCLHHGCVPSKSLIHVAKVVQGARQAARFGLGAADLAIDMAKVAEYIQGVIGRVGEAEQVYVEGVDVRFGTFAFTSPHEFTLDGEALSSQSFLIATGSRPAVPQIEGLAAVGYLTNEGAFDLLNLPPSLVVVGGGPVGCELAQAFARLGSRVTLVQGPDRLLPKEDPEVSAALAAIFDREGIAVITGARLLRARRDGEEKVIEARQGDRTIEVRARDILIALGRTPTVADLGLEMADVDHDARGIEVNEHLQTSASNIYAVGDVLGGYLFTHVAASQAGVAIRNILLPIARTKVNYDALPWVTFTDPEAARLGLTEEEAARRGPVRVIRLPWADIDRAQAEGATEGFIKLVIGAKDDTLLGAHLVGAHAGELLAELALAMKHNLGLSDILGTIHAYPTYSTGIQQAAFAAYLESPSLQSARKLLKPVLSLRG